MSCQLQSIRCEEEEARMLMEENEMLRDEIRKLAVSTELQLSCSNTTCALIDSSSIDSSKSLNSDSEDTSEIATTKPPSRNIVRCILDHPSRLRLREKDLVDYREETKMLVSEVDRRTIGEIALQLDRRILQYVFAPRKRLYGFTVRNIRAKIDECSTDVVEGVVDRDARTNLTEKYESLVSFLNSTAGYHELYHAVFSEILINAFGVLQIKSRKPVQYQYLKNLIENILKKCYEREAIILLDSLEALAKIDGKRLFI